MEADKASFEQLWKEAGEDQRPEAIETAWTRYNQIKDRRPKYQDPTIVELQAAFEPLVESVCDDVQCAKYLVVDGKRPPWSATQLRVEAGQEVSVFATGRLWRSRALDLWLGPQFGLWCRLGENGTAFNSTHATNTFTAEASANLYLATQFPGQFGDPSGRVAGPLQVYDKAEGEFAVVIIVWRSKASVPLRKMVEAGDPFWLLSTELNRQAQPTQIPQDWHFLWFLGVSNIFSEREHQGAKCICCHTQGNVGILQKEVVLPLLPDTVLTWDWVVSALPSRLREDTTASHDYLSLAVEFENGRDLTYTWSWELPIDFGYWCPLATWKDREYHVVVRSGTKEIGSWLSEKRSVREDYERYVGGIPPDRIVRVWLIAGSRWQRHVGDMVIKKIKFTSSDGVCSIT